MKKSSLFLRLARLACPSLCIARVSDLLRKGVDRERIAHDFVRINQEVWGSLTNSAYVWTCEKVQQHFAICPQHIYCAFENGRMVATLTNIRMTEEDIHTKKSWLEKTGNGCLTTYARHGTVGFGADLSVVKGTSKGVSDRIVLVALLVSILGENGRAVYLGARIPSYYKHPQLPVEDYVYGRTRSGKPRDPELRFYLKNGFEIVEIIPDYMEDPQSLNYGVLMKWTNPLYPVTRRASFLATAIKKLGQALFVRVPAGLYGAPKNGDWLRRPDHAPEVQPRAAATVPAPVLATAEKGATES
jgi:hypothetical protein